jgi:hypothetical protein
MFQKNMECAELIIKEETEDETKYESSSLHHNIGVFEEDSSKVMNPNANKISFQILIFIASLAISQSSCRFVMRSLARCF